MQKYENTVFLGPGSYISPWSHHLQLCHLDPLFQQLEDAASQAKDNLMRRHGLLLQEMKKVRSTKGSPQGSLGISGNFWDLSGIFWIFSEISGFLVKISSESCRRLRDLQKSIVILSNGAIWTRNVTLLMKTLPP